MTQLRNLTVHPHDSYQGASNVSFYCFWMVRKWQIQSQTSVGYHKKNSKGEEVENVLFWQNTRTRGGKRAASFAKFLEQFPWSNRGCYVNSQVAGDWQGGWWCVPSGEATPVSTPRRGEIEGEPQLSLHLLMAWASVSTMIFWQIYFIMRERSIKT